MVKYFESTCVFRFSWDEVAQGFWRRYPNPHRYRFFQNENGSFQMSYGSNHVLSEDTVFREVRGNRLFTKRLLTKTNRVPKWGERFVNARTVKIVEESITDPNEKILITYTRNIGYSRVMSIVEKVVYKVSRENPNWTVAERSAWIDSQVFGFGRAIQAFGFERFRKNCHQMVGGFNYVLTTMFPHSASSVSHMTADEVTNQTTSAKKETLKDAAKKATDLAKSKAGPIYASCQPNQT